MLHFLLWLLYGAIIGWVAGLIMRSTLNLGWSIVLGIVGSMLGGFIASLLGFGDLGGTFSFNIVNMLVSLAGACLVLIIARTAKRTTT